MPIQPTGFDRAFRALGSDFKTLKCSWSNYNEYNANLHGVRSLIADFCNLNAVRLVDAHSWCWIFSTLLKEEALGPRNTGNRTKDVRRVLGGRETSIIAMRHSVENTVPNTNGQAVLDLPGFSGEPISPSGR